MSDGTIDTLGQRLDSSLQQVTRALNGLNIIASRTTEESQMTWTLLRDELNEAMQLRNDRVAALRLFQEDLGVAIPVADHSDYEQQARVLCEHVEALSLAEQATHSANAADDAIAGETGGVTITTDSLPEQAIEGVTDRKSSNEVKAADSTVSEAVAQTSIQSDTMVECTGCLKEVVEAEAAKADCGHDYCPDCAIQLFETALMKGSIFPPSCCDNKPLRFEEVLFYMSADLIKRFDRKEIEVKTENPLHCANQACLTFIPSTDIFNDRGQCSECPLLTCAICKSRTHKGECNTTDDEGLAALQETVEANKWQTCPGCKMIVEKTRGCVHMICRCGVQFCYNCGTLNGTCGYCASAT